MTGGNVCTQSPISNLQYPVSSLQSYSPTISKEMTKNKVEGSEALNRMNTRLNILEEEMKKAVENKEKRKRLEDDAKGKEMKVQPAGTKEVPKDSSIDKNVTEGTYRSTFAKEIEQDLRKDAAWQEEQKERGKEDERRRREQRRREDEKENIGE